MSELKQSFNLECDKLLVFFNKATTLSGVGTKKEQAKILAENLLIITPRLLKRIKYLKNTKRDALLDRYYLKCRMS